MRVAKALEASENRVRVKIIEKNRLRAEFSAGSLERTIVLYGDGLDSGLLEEANVSKTDAILAVTDDDKTLFEIRWAEAYSGEQWCEFRIQDCNGKAVKSDEPSDYYGGVHPYYMIVVGNIFEGVKNEH